MARKFIQVGVCCLIAAQSFAADVVISEFMASNSRTLPDETGVYPDWIEIQNTTETNINLNGWSLTDSASNLTKWRFPATNLPPFSFMVVFADGNDRRTPGAPLHTSFSLSADGEYLALVRPDRSIATEFRPQYLPQVTDISFGFGALATNTTHINSNSTVRVRIPASGADGANWTMIGFNDAAWTAGTNRVGFAAADTAQADYGAAVLPMGPVAYFRMNETSGSTAVNLGSSGTPGAYGSITLGTAGPRPPQFSGFEPNNNAPTFNGSSSYATANSPLLSGRNSFTIAGWIKLSANPAARTGLFGQNDCVEFGFSAPNNLQCWTPSGAANLAWTPPLNEWVHVLAVADGSTIRLFTNGVQGTSGTASPNVSNGNSFNIGGNGILDTTGNFFPGQLDEVVVFHRALSASEITALYQAGLTPSASPLAALIKTDVGTAMSNVNASAYIRIPFNIPDTNNVSLVTLKTRYNDGFIAHINGEEVGRMNAPESAAYNSAATAGVDGLASTEFRFFGSMLTNGSNVLAVQALNASAANTNFFFEAELATTSAALTSTNPVYFTVPTPGAENNAGVTNPGPAIVEVNHTPRVPNDSEDVVVTARVLPSFAAVGPVVVRYRVMFGNEAEADMFDDGLHNDGAANDGIFGATLPISSTSTNGEMVRWYFRATDVQGQVSRWPLFANPANGAEYLGTIVETNVASKLPVIHLFAPTNVLSAGPSTPQVGADSQSGGRVAVFYDGEFYDNVEMNLRGNSTAGFNKKSHRMNFNNEHPFRSPNDRGSLRNTSFVADYPDPTYMRQGLSFWLTEQMGVPSAFYDPVRLQLNTAFYQLANHNNVVGREQLEWLGYQPDGALYKAAGQMVPSQASTGGFEKKTRLTEPNTDYATMTAAIAETVPVRTRYTNAFEHLDVPAILNYLVAARFVHENDDVWANMTIYRDTLGDGLWRIIPFDMNLSWGAIFYEGGAACQVYVEGVQATNDQHKAHPLYGASTTLPCGSGNYNRMYDLFFQVPELRQMYLRRLRTLLDTWVLPPGTPTNSTFVEQMILARRDLIAEEALRDRAKWGWPGKGGQSNFDPGINITNGVAGLLNNFFLARRHHFYERHTVANTAVPIGVTKNNNAGIPLAQPTNAVIHVAGFEYNPSSGNQGHEYIAITNPNPYTLDLSGWKLDGAVDFTFKPGTVLLSNAVLYVTPDLLAFRTRTTTPRAGQGLFVVGNYNGQLSARGETIIIRDDAGRLVSSNSYPGNPSLPQQYLRITELMYNPPAPSAGSPYGAQDFEYIELKNIGPVPINLVGVHFTNGIDFTFTATNALTSLAAGQTVVLVKNPAAFISRYGAGTTIAGTFGGSLDSGGERIQLHDAVGESILDFTYNNTWYPVTDGLGFSLVIVDETAPFNTWDRKSSWRPSGRVNGSPGVVDPAPVSVEAVLVNEVLAASVSPQVDSIEIWNPTTNTATIGGWFISDDFYTPKKYRIATGTTIPPGGYMVFTEAQFNANPLLATSFAFSSSGDEAYLFAADATGNLLGYYHGFDFNASDAGVSFGRYLTSQTNEHFVAQSSQTLGAANAGPRVGPVVISEIMYHPPDSNGNDDQELEYIELRNISEQSVALYDVAAPTNRWRLKDAVDFDFPTGTTLAAGEALLVVSFNPTNIPVLDAFRAKYGIASSVSILGPYQGKLDNSAENVELAHPQPVTTNGFSYVLSDKVDYDESGLWNHVADGFGAALHRIVVSSYGNDPTNWTAAAASPGGTYTAGPGPVITLHPSDAIMLEGGSTNLSVIATGTGLRYQWQLNGANVPDATNATLLLNNADASQSGTYQVAVFDAAGATLSSSAHVAIFIPVKIIAHPVSRSGPPGTNAVFNVAAQGNGSLDYQWNFNGAPILGATNASLVISNAQLFEDAGYYDVRVSDILSSAQSSTGTLTVLVRPVVTNAPQSVSVVRGGTAVFRVVAGPDHPLLPISYRWFSTNGTPPNNMNSVLVLTNCQVDNSIRLNVSNLAGQTNITQGIRLTVLNDADGDGIPDVWEDAFGLDKNNPNDATTDTDGDGMITRDEYGAGTDPNDAASVLRLGVSAVSPVLLSFTGQSNVSYTIQFRADLSTASWLNWSNVPAEGIIRAIEFPGGTNDARFFRIVTPQEP